METEETFRRICASAKDAIIMMDNEGVISYWNDAAEKIFGYSSKEAIGKELHVFLAPERIFEAYREGFRRFKETGMGHVVGKTLVMTAIKKDGMAFPVELSVSAIKIEGKWSAVGILRDITGRKLFEEACKENRINLETMVSKIPDGIIIVSRQGIVQFVNPAAESLFDRTAEELLGSTFGFPVLEGNKMEIDTISKNGDKGVAEMRAMEINWDGKLSYLVSLFDITAIKKADEKLQEANERLKSLDQRKSEFISIASHELRTPMTSINNAINIILQRKAGEVNDAQEKFLSMADRNIKRLSNLINDLLDITKIEAGKLELNVSEIDISNTIISVISTLNPLAKEKTISLNTTNRHKLPVMYGDVYRIEQMLINLVGNAIKFTPDRGTIIIDAHQTEDVSSMSHRELKFIEISITDTGIGISKEDIDKIFDKFSQVGSTLDNKHPGTGLGLAICKGIVEAHGGKLQCKSKVNKGSTFSVTLPVIDKEMKIYGRLTERLSNARERQEPLSILLITIRDFKHFMKVYKVKERCNVLAMLKEKINEVGIKTTDDICILQFAPEILLIMPNTNRMGALVVQKRIEKYISNNEIAVQDNNRNLPSICSVARFPEDGASAEELIDYARRGAIGDWRKLYGTAKRG